MEIERFPGHGWRVGIWRAAVSVNRESIYLSAVDDQLRHADDRPSIGLLLCKERDHLTVEYALRDLKKPVGVAQWQTQLVESLPRNLKGSLPSVAETEAELDKARAK
jgi:hypothetical protein